MEVTYDPFGSTLKSKDNNNDDIKVSDDAVTPITYGASFGVTPRHVDQIDYLEEYEDRFLPS